MKSSPKTEHIPVIFLTSKDNEMDEVQGLRLGADDYITKPFSQRLLLERVRTILRRQERLRPKDGSKPLLLESVTQGDLTMEDASYTCLWKGEKVDLTVTEYLVLKGLVINPTHVKTRDQLIEYAYKDPINVDDRTIDSHIKRIRKKIRAVDSDFDQIFSIYGVGYSYSK